MFVNHRDILSAAASFKKRVMWSADFPLRWDKSSIMSVVALFIVNTSVKILFWVWTFMSAAAIIIIDNNVRIVNRFACGVFNVNIRT